MSLTLVGFVGAGATLALGAKMVGLPIAFAGFLGLAVVLLGFGVQSFLKVEAPAPQPKKRKLTKKEKKALKEEEEGPPPSPTPAQKRRLREKEKKAEKKAQEKAEKAAAAKEAKKLREEEKKLKAKNDEKAKRKAAKKAAKKKKVKTASEAEGADTTPAVVEPEQAWTEVPVSSRNQKKALAADQDEKEPEFEVEVDVPRKYFGAIIGERGANLHAIQDHCSVKIDVPKEGGIRREIIITGPEQGCADAKKAILQLVKQGFSEITHANTTGDGIDVPAKSRRVLIGPGGANIKQLQVKTGCKINIPKDSEDSTMVTLVGSPEGVAAAKRAITQLISQGYSDLTHEGHEMTSLQVPRDMLRKLIGTGGSTIKALQKDTNTRINIGADDGEFVEVAILGLVEDTNKARAQIEEMMVPPEPEPIPTEWTAEATSDFLEPEW